MARPSKYNDKVAESICSGIADGKSLKSICEDSKMPHRDTVRKWRRDNEEFNAMYTLAREEQAESFADKIIDVAEDEKINPSRARNIMDAIKWAAAKQLPKQYGEKVVHDVNLKKEVDLSGLSTDEIVARALAAEKLEKPEH